MIEVSGLKNGFHVRVFEVSGLKKRQVFSCFVVLVPPFLVRLPVVGCEYFSMLSHMSLQGTAMTTFYVAMVTVKQAKRTKLDMKHVEISTTTAWQRSPHTTFRGKP